MKKIIFWSTAFLLAGCSGANNPPDVSIAPTTEPTSTTISATDTSPPAASGIDHMALLRQLLFEVESREGGKRVLAQIENTADTRFVAGLIDVMRYQRSLAPEIGNTLRVLTEAELTASEAPVADWHDWVEWAGQHPELESFPEYDRWKSTLYSLIDPSFQRFIYADINVAPDSRLEEIVWGGVRVDGIPALDNPTMLDPAEVTYLIPQERVFGVSINGDTRAYPARFLDWHEMFNDVVGGEPVSLAY